MSSVFRRIQRKRTPNVYTYDGVKIGDSPDRHKRSSWMNWARDIDRARELPHGGVFKSIGTIAPTSLESIERVFQNARNISPPRWTPQASFALMELSARHHFGKALEKSKPASG